MTQIQLNSQRITDLAAARALRQDDEFLKYFLEPISPSDVAPRLGMAANLAHHHANKLADLGLLFEARREGGKVLYQLVAREFRVPSDLLPPGDEAGNGTANMRKLSDEFLHAYERSWRTMKEGEEDIYGFGAKDQPVSLPPQPDSPAVESYPTHFDALTVRLTPARYQQLARALSALLDEAMNEANDDVKAKKNATGQTCTLAVLAFQKQMPAPEPEKSVSISRNLDSFLGKPEAVH
ncbi:winged helix-turn-helix domain-containing protein [Deinococcus sp.]|uniref:winged helix-turn-helix domain-containing protein n=1 Tax=Deinococcus sp. TaxID=47478 RepID=UPI003B5CCDB4